jgi:exodeoxyribonuclease VII small subunit
MSGKKEKSFEEQMKRLEEIVALLERGDAQLKDSLALFEEGTKLVKSCSEQLEKAEQQVVKLQKGPDGEPEELPFVVEEP